MFAKLFEPDLGKQILVKIDGGEEGPEVRIFCEPEGLGVCSIAMMFPESDEGWEKAKKAFRNVNEEEAIKISEKICQAALGK